MLIYDKSGRKLRHRSLLSFFVVEILTTQESVAKLNPQMVISPQQRKIIKFCGVILFHFYHRSHNQTNSLFISKCRRRYILTNTWQKTKMLSSSGQIFFSFILCLWNINLWNADEKRFQWYIGLPTFLLLFFLCVQSSKSCHKGSILTTPPPRELYRSSFKIKSLGIGHSLLPW